MLPGVTDRRRSPRYPLNLSIELDAERGVTRDVSASGVFFETERSYVPGALIQFTLILEYADPAAPLCLDCQGQVVRVEATERRFGVAAVITSQQIRPSRP